MRNSLLSGILRIFFRLLYQELAWTYDIVAWAVSAGLWSEWIRQIIPFAQGPSVLELGHGPGHLQIELARRGYRTFGLDLSREMGRLAYPRIQKSLNNNISGNGYAQLPNLARGRAQTLPFPSGSFESVIATFPTEYIFDPATLAEIYRVLAPGGRLAVLFTGWITGYHLHERAAAALFRVTGQSGEWFPDWARSFHQAGFSTEARWIPLASSRVLVIAGQKPGSQPQIMGTKAARSPS